MRAETQNFDMKFRPKWVKNAVFLLAHPKYTPLNLQVTVLLHFLRTERLLLCFKHI